MDSSVNLNDYKIDGQVARMLPEEMVRRLNTLPMRMEANELYIATTAPLNLPGMDETRMLTGLKVKSALVYSKIVAVLCLAAAVFMLSFIVPRFAALYDKLGLKLPLPTVLLIETSEFVLEFWWAILGGVAGVILAYKKFSTSSAGREVLDRIKLRLPVLGDLNRKVAVSRFVRVLGALDTSGVPIMQSLEVAGHIANNVVIHRIIDKVRTNVRAGGNLEEPLLASSVFPSIVVQMIAMGEEAGRLGESLEKSVSYLESELDDTVTRLITKLEPALTIIIAGMVGLFALAIYLPMFNIIKGISEF